VSQEQTRSVLLVVLGAMAVWLWGSGQALNYVRPGLVPLVGAAGLVLLGLALLPPLGLLSPGWAGHRSDGSGDQGGHQHQHQHGGRVGWLLLVPVLVVLLVQPAALGSYAVSSRTVVPGSGGNGQFPPLSAPVRGAVPMPTDRVRRPGRGQRQLPVDPLRHLLLRRRRRGPPSGHPRGCDPAGPRPVAGGRGHLGAAPSRGRRPDPTTAGLERRHSPSHRPTPPPVRVHGPVQRLTTTRPATHLRPGTAGVDGTAGGWHWGGTGS
jgi:hypothetical protein